MTCRESMPTPTWQGLGGRAWKLAVNPAHPVLPAHAGHLGVYLLEIPRAHPAWDCYWLGIIHLRDIPCVSPAHKEFDSATHEIMMYALDPTRDHEQDGCVIPNEGPAFLLPANLVEQVELPSDEAAAKLLEFLVRSFVDGILSPDTDYRKWQQRAIQAAAMHFREGRHVHYGEGRNEPS
jgi:hypothetical protein